MVTAVAVLCSWRVHYSETCDGWIKAAHDAQKTFVPPILACFAFFCRLLFGHFQQFKTLEKEEGRRAELDEIDKLLRQDLRNNSVWNHRWFVLHSTLGSEPLSDEVRGKDREALQYGTA